MNSLFNMDNGLFTFLGKLCDIMIVSFVWVLLCIPIVTIGPATTALYYTSVKVLRGERGYIMGEFFRSFKLNFKRAAIIGLILTGAAAILALDIYAATNNDIVSTKVNAILYGVYIALAILVLSISIYIFPLLSRFDMNIKQLFKAAAYMALRHLPSTICMVVVFVASVIGTGFLVLTVVIFPAIVCLIDSLFLERIFKIYIAKGDAAVDAKASQGDNGDVDNEGELLEITTDQDSE